MTITLYTSPQGITNLREGRKAYGSCEKSTMNFIQINVELERLEEYDTKIEQFLIK